MSRTTISGVQLYAILDAEWKKIRPRACSDCRIPLPYWREPPDDVSANWAIGTPRQCQHGCHALIAELVTTLWTKYDIEAQLVQ